MAVDNKTVDLDEARIAKRTGSKRHTAGRSGANGGKHGQGRRRDDDGGRKGPGRTVPPALAWGLSALVLTLVLAKPVAGWLMGPYMFLRMRTATTAISSLEAGVAGNAVLIRDEAVILSPTAGTLHMLVKPGDRVRKGTEVLRVDDNGSDPGAESAEQKAQDELQRVRMAKAQRLSELQEEAARIQTGIDSIRKELKGRSTKAARERLRTSISTLKRVMMEMDDVREADPNIAKVLGTGEKGVWAAFGKESYTFRAPIPGLVMNSTDGLEGALNINGRLEDLPRIVEDVASSTGHPAEWGSKVVKDGEEVRYGYPVGRIINNFTAHLAVVLPGDRMKGYRGDRVRIRFDSLPGKSLSATHVRTLPGSRDGQVVAIFGMDDFIPEFTDLRADKVELVRNRYEGVVVPERAVTERDGVKGVYVAKGWYPVWQKVEIKAAAGGKCVVTGIPAGNKVVVNPGIVPDGF